MKATIVRRYGALSRSSTSPTPDLRTRDVLIAVRAASLNPLDFKIRDGKVKLVLRLKPPVCGSAAMSRESSPRSGPR